MKSINPHFLAMLVLLSMPLFLITCKIESDDPAPRDAINWGYVKEYHTEKPIPNAMLVLYGKNPMWAIQDTLYTDSNGRYEFPQVNYLPDLEASAPNYIGDRVYTQDELVGRFNRTIHLYQPAEMILHVKNVKPFNENDLVDLPDFFAPMVQLSGANVDTFICCLTARRYTEVIIGVWLTKNQNRYSNNVKHRPTKATGNIVDVFY